MADLFGIHKEAFTTWYKNRGRNPCKTLQPNNGAATPAGGGGGAGRRYGAAAAAGGRQAPKRSRYGVGAEGWDAGGAPRGSPCEGGRRAGRGGGRWQTGGRGGASDSGSDTQDEGGAEEEWEAEEQQQQGGGAQAGPAEPLAEEQEDLDVLVHLQKRASAGVPHRM